MTLHISVLTKSGDLKGTTTIRMMTYMDLVRKGHREECVLRFGRKLTNSRGHRALAGLAGPHGKRNSAARGEKTAKEEDYQLELLNF